MRPPPAIARKMFDGLRSRCVTPRRCASATGVGAGLMSAVSTAESRPERWSRRESSLTSGGCHHEVARPASSPTSLTSTMCGSKAGGQLSLLKGSSARGRIAASAG